MHFWQNQPPAIREACDDPQTIGACCGAKTAILGESEHAAEGKLLFCKGKDRSEKLRTYQKSG